MSAIARLDAVQQRSRSTAVAIATVKKFSEDESTGLATMIAFWAFFSIFPLLLVFVTVLGWVLPASSKESVLNHVAQTFPLLDPSTVKSLGGAVWALLLGLFSALWSGLAVVRTTQSAFNSVWDVPRRRRAGLAEQVIRSLAVLVTIGAGLVLTTVVSGFVTSASRGVNIGVAGQIGGYVLAAALDVGLMLAAFRILTDRSLTTRDVMPGALLAGLIFFILQQVSALVISRYLHNAQSTYGHFATVITILWWFYLQSIVTLLGAQLNVVLKERLYPRSLAGGPQTEADRRAVQAYGEDGAHRPGEEVAAGVSPTSPSRTS
jgi:YihY family inner membrane protein